MYYTNMNKEKTEWRPVNINFKEFEAERKAWVAEHKIKVTMPQFIAFLLDYYKIKEQS